jgi:hypothetical protein
MKYIQHERLKNTTTDWEHIRGMYNCGNIESANTRVFWHKLAKMPDSCVSFPYKHSAGRGDEMQSGDTDWILCHRLMVFIKIRKRKSHAAGRILLGF